MSKYQVLLYNDVLLWLLEEVYIAKKNIKMYFNEIKNYAEKISLLK